MIPNEQSIVDVFGRMKADGVDTSKPLCWGFLFVHSSRERLLAVVAELDGFNYVVEDLSEHEPGEWHLYVTKTEVLSADKLHRRNVSFNELAEYCGVDLYDGWDVDVRSVPRDA